MRTPTPLPSPEPPPPGPGMHHALLRQHLTNMTAMQVQVCTRALAEYEEVVERAAVLEAENVALVRRLADVALQQQPKPTRRSRPPAARVNGNGAHR